ncbi:MAG: TIGR01777 family oxidoreductase [Coraliomargaritaceae bacterium]
MKSVKKILITGASGLVGRSLAAFLRAEGHEIVTLSRTSGDFLWDVESGQMDRAALQGVDCVVHLAGESIAQRWTQSSQERILRSRVESTRLLVDGILKADQPIDFLCASGVNYYGHQCGEGQTEQAAAGDGFLAEVCQQWEAAHRPLSDAGLRTVSLRIGVVLSAEGGAVQRLLPIFRTGLGGPAGPGHQLMSWIGLPDLTNLIVHTILHREIIGPVNAVAPHPATNADFSHAFGRALSRPAFLPIPGFMLRLLYGDMADETILSHVGAIPSVLESAGFVWQSPRIEEALQQCFLKK